LQGANFDLADPLARHAEGGAKLLQGLWRFGQESRSDDMALAVAKESERVIQRAA
jgi:hypothetical protein